MFARVLRRFAGGHGRSQPEMPGRAGGEIVVMLADGRTKATSELVRGDRMVIEAGEVIPCNGTVIEGVGLVDESAITGESAPVIREPVGDRSAVIGGTRVLSNRIMVEVTEAATRTWIG